MKNVLSLFVLAITSIAFAQQRPLTHQDYDLWNSIRSTHISPDGNIIAFAITTTTGRGDSYVVIHNVDRGTEARFENASRPVISYDGQYVFFRKDVPYDVERQEKKDDVDSDEKQKRGMSIYSVRKRQLVETMDRVKSFTLPDEFAGYAIIEKYKDLKPEEEPVDSTLIDTTMVSNDTIEKPEPRWMKKDYALVYRLGTGTMDTIQKIKDYEISDNGSTLIYTTTNGKKKGDIGVFYHNAMSGENTVLDTVSWNYSNLNIDRQGKQVVYMAARDSTEVDSLKHEMWYVGQNRVPRVIIDSLGKNLRNNWELNTDATPYFSHNGIRLFFESKPIVRFEKDTTMLDDEYPAVDVWNWQDGRVMPEQEVRNDQISSFGYASFFNPSNNSITNLHEGDVEGLITDWYDEQRYFLGVSNTKYQSERSWQSPWVDDYYIIDTQNNTQVKALEGIASYPELSPDGNYAVYYDQNERDWKILNLASGARVNATENIAVNFWDEDDDHPMLPYSYGFGGFMQDGSALVFDKFDIWKIELASGNTTKITPDGRLNKRQYRTTYLNERDRRYVTEIDGKLLLRAFDETTKMTSLWLLNPKNGKIVPKLAPAGYTYNGFAKAENNNTFIFRKSNFNVYPDLQLVTGNMKFNSRELKYEQISNANPQQSQFNWGSVESIQWTAYDGKELEGLLYKPDNFDPNKEYPMITYFYETYSERLYGYRSPQPSASTVNFAYLTSNDYLVFVPDIKYEDGHPGDSAYNCIVSGVEMLAQKLFVNASKIGIQGQSWGGYQTAFLITKTNMFAAAMAGAPVSNMTSAYGGIRWGSGLSRAFQYERTQTRIGENLWDGFDLYIENSPLFGIPEIETPLLMMHNDEDGAVPYYQGIEMFMGMRRLQKPVWLLVYNGEAHNLRKMKNKQDLSIRMMQFIDHDLKGEGLPVWMSDGRPYQYKEETLGYEIRN